MLGTVFVPKSHPAFRKAVEYLTFDVFNYAEQENEEFRAYQDAPKGIFIPREYGRQLGFKPHTVSYGFALEDDCIQPVELRDEQVPFVDSMTDLAELVYEEDNYPCIDIRAEAGTGKGKTVMALEVCRRLQVTTIIIVDQEFLRDQWIERATELFGVPEEEIGIVQGRKEDWYGKSIVIGMIQSLYDRDMPEEFWQYFGFVIFDESHTVGAKLFSQILQQFPAAIRLGVSATSERTDELELILKASLGSVQLILQSRHAQSTVRYLTYPHNSYSWYANTSPKAGRYISEIASDGLRNKSIASVVRSLYQDGHYILAISDRVEQCEDVATLLILEGVPESDIGIVAGFRSTFKLVKNDKPLRKPYGYQRGTSYSPLVTQRVRKRTKTKDLNNEKTKRIVLATYGKFEKGVDVPQLSAGIDMTPRAKAQQVHGRILREMTGKLEPVWVTIRDIRSYRAEHQFANRVAEYVKSNAEVYEWQVGKEPVLRDANHLAVEARQSARHLKEGEITTKCDGNYTVVAKRIVRGRSSPRVKPTGKTTRKGRTR